CIGITKTCDSTATPGGTVHYSGTVTNCGNVTLTNVVVLDTVPGVQTNVQVLGPITLAPGASSPYSSTYTVPATFCGILTNTATATANTICGASVGPRSANCTTTVVSTPCLAVTKVCPTVTTVNLSSPSYSVSGFVTNCGTATMTNVVVVDI